MDRISDLPDLALQAIFDHLDMRSLVNCRATSKRFRFWADQARPRELVVQCEFRLENPFHLGELNITRWYNFGDKSEDNPKDKIDEGNVVKIGSNVPCWVLFKGITFSLQGCLRCLKINFTIRRSEFELLNQLVALRHLELYELTGKVNLSLPNLKVFYLYGIKSEYEHKVENYLYNMPNPECEHMLTVDCPRLETFFCVLGMREIKLEPGTAKSIKTLETVSVFLNSRD